MKTKILLEEFYEETSRKHKKLYKKEVFEKNLIKISPLGLLDLCLDMCNNGGIESLRNTRSEFSSFYDYLIQKGYVKINPFREYDVLSYKSMSRELAERSDVAVLYEEDIEKIVKLIKDEDLNEKDLKILLVRGFFEGIPTLDDFVELESNNIDFENRTIRIQNGSVVNEFSDKFFAALSEYSNNLEIFVKIPYGRRVRSDRTKYKDRIIKYDVNKKTSMKSDKEYNQYAKNKIRKSINEISNAVYRKYNVKITSKNLIVSGFLNYVFNFAKDYKTFVEICRENQSRILQKLGRLYGMKNVTRLKFSIYVYVYKSKWFQEFLSDPNISDMEKEKFSSL